jgi:hypothetical protein
MGENGLYRLFRLVMFTALMCHVPQAYWDFAFLNNNLKIPQLLDVSFNIRSVT